MNGKGSGRRVPDRRFCSKEQEEENWAKISSKQKFNPHKDTSISLSGDEVQAYFKEQRKPCNKCKSKSTCNRKGRRTCSVYLEWQSSR